MKTKKLEIILKGIILLVLLVNAIASPKVWKLVLIGGCIISDIGSLLFKKEKSRTDVWWAVLLQLFGIIIVVIFSPFYNLLFPYYAPYEYRWDIAELKKTDMQKYNHFPEEIPDIANKVKWRWLPNMLQGTGYELLLFYANSAYLREMCVKYEEHAMVYVYKDTSWENAETKKVISFPEATTLSEQERENVIVYVTYDNQNECYPHTSGFYVNEVEGYICYFAQ